MGRATLLHQTPGMVSTSTFWLFWASWKALMLLKATSKASLTVGSNSGSGRSCEHIPANGHQSLLSPKSCLMVVTRDSLTLASYLYGHADTVKLHFVKFGSPPQDGCVPFVPHAVNNRLHLVIVQKQG